MVRRRICMYWRSRVVIKPENAKLTRISSPVGNDHVPCGKQQAMRSVQIRSRILEHFHERHVPRVEYPYLIVVLVCGAERFSIGMKADLINETAVARIRYQIR